MLDHKIDAYRRKYYINRLIKGGLLSISAILSYFLIINIVEYFGALSTITRAVLFFSFLGITLGCFFFWVAIPAFKLFKLSKTISDYEAAQQIGRFFPEVRDKLLNALQLQQLTHEYKTDLVKESIAQKNTQLNDIDFTRAINLSVNKKYLRFLLPPFLLTLLVFLFVPQLFTESTPRLVNYTKDYKKESPFSFNIINNPLQVFKNEDFTLQVNLSGIAVPEKLHLVTQNGRKLKLEKGNGTDFTYTFNKVQRDIQFYLEASGFESSQYTLEVLSRPSLLSFNVFLDYPEYTAKTDVRMQNTGNLRVPEGTKISWYFQTQAADELSLDFDGEESIQATQEGSSKNIFVYEKQAKLATKYQVNLKNKYSQNKDIIEYFLNVTPDEFPTISVNQYEDTVLYESLVLGGNIGDDYGISRLSFYYRIIGQDVSENQKANLPFESKPITYNQELINQSFFYNIDLTKFSLAKGSYLEYFVEVADNDQVNGAKTTKSPTFRFNVPTQEEIKKELAAQSKGTQEKMENTFEEAKEIYEELESLEDKLKGKKRLSWQDKKAVENLIKKRQNLEKEIEQLQQLNKQFNQKQENLNFKDEEIAKKAEQLQKLMDELLDEETRKLYEELSKLMDQNLVNQNLQELLEDLKLKQENIESELDRALELFKKLKFDAKLKEIEKELEELAEEQQQLADETEKNTEEQQLEEQQEKQENLNEDFRNLQEELKNLDKLNQEMQNPQNIDNLSEKEMEIAEEQQKAQEQLQQQNSQKASESQKKSAQKMKEMAQQMQAMQQSAQMQQLTENYEDLRSILENLITLSFSQEELMLAFRDVRRIDPKFIELSQQQLKLKDDAQLIQDSLLSLSKRVFQIESFVTREVSQMNKYMDESLDAIRKRTPEIASSKQQFTMTSVNNLALLLNDILQQMQQQMSQSMSGQQMNEKQQGSPSLSELQRQLNQQIQNLKKSGKSGKELSQELAKLAAQQEMIRNALKQQAEGSQDMEGKEGKQGDDGYKEMIEQMEKTEEDLVNKRITQETIRRQKEILTRLLQSEKAEKERELDEKREAESAKNKLQKDLPKDFLEYLKLKESQVELLKTIPPSLNKYYKKQVNEYFKSLDK